MSRFPRPKPAKRLPGTGASCTKCGATGDEKFNRTIYNTLNSWCKGCLLEYNRQMWRKNKMTTKPRKP